MSFLQSVNRLLVTRGTTSYSLKVITTNGLIDSNAPSKGSSSTSVTHSLLSYPGKYKTNQVDGELIKKDDVKLYVDPTDLAVVPKTDDIILFSADQWKIKDVIQYTVVDAIVLYILQIRK